MLSNTENKIRIFKVAKFLEIYMVIFFDILRVTTGTYPEIEGVTNFV